MNTTVINAAPTDAIVRFSCLPGGCTMRIKDGSVLVSNAGVELEGRAINMWGPVIKSPNFDPNQRHHPDPYPGLRRFERSRR